MAGTVTRKQAEGYWKKNNKDGNDELTVEEVKQCFQEVYDNVDDFNVNEKFTFFGQQEARALTKETFLAGKLRSDKCTSLEQQFKAMDKRGSGSLSKEELESGGIRYIKAASFYSNRLRRVCFKAAMMNKVVIACLVLAAFCIALTTAQGFQGQTPYNVQSPMASLGFRPQQQQQQQQPFDMSMLWWLAMMEGF